jgi:hypothetical protein
MQKLYKVRQLHGSVYASVISDDLVVPWHPLTIGDYIKYNQEYSRGNCPNCILENEIFQKCVVDEAILRQMDQLPAGVVTTVVENIWKFSGPIDIDAFNGDLEVARQIIFNSDTKAIHEIVDLITRAWPYKPEEVYAMDYETLLLRCAMAEPRLTAAGILTEPIHMQKIKQDPSDPTVEKPKIDAKRLWEEYQASQGAQPTSQQKPPQKASGAATEASKKKPKGRWWKTSPILEASNPKKIDFAGEQMATDMDMLDSHDKAESPEMRKYLIDSKNRNLRAKMIEEAQVAYADALEGLKKRQGTK